MEINLGGAASEIGTRDEKTSSNQPLLENQTNSRAREKVVEVRKVSIKKVKDWTPRPQPESAPNGVIKLVIEPPCDSIE